MNIFNFNDFRSYLKHELSDRIGRNPNYSQRSMAKGLGIAHSTLSEVINGHTNLSATKARTVATKLGLKKVEVEYFCDLVQANTEKNLEVREALLNKIEKLYPRSKKSKDLNIDIFKQISNWYHSAILELPYLKRNKLDSSTASKLLGIPKLTAELAIERLIKLGFLEVTENGSINRVSQDLRVESDIKNSAMRKYYRQMLNKISEALDNQSPDERLSGYLNIPLDIKALPELDVAIDNFFLDIKRINKKYKNKTKVYHLSCHLINLTNKEK